MQKLYFLSIAFVALALFSCQNDEITVTQNTAESLTKTSPLALLISRVAQNETFYDNIIDNTSCFSVKLPVTVFVNGQEITVYTEQDYSTVVYNINASAFDDDVVNFIYPITVIFKDYVQMTVNSQNQLDTIMGGCSEEDGFNEITCIDFNFPLVINTYDSSNQIAGTVTIDNNIELYNSIADAEINNIMGIVYPISVVNSTLATITINSNNDLESALENAIPDCNPDGGGNPLELQDVISDGTWRVSYFWDNEDETAMYEDYDLTFFANASLTAIKNNTMITGTWSVYIEDSQQKIDLDFDDSDLGDLDDEWKVIEFTETDIRLKNQSGGGGGNEYLYFTKN